MNAMLKAYEIDEVLHLAAEKRNMYYQKPLMSA